MVDSFVASQRCEDRCDQEHITYDGVSSRSDWLLLLYGKMESNVRNYIKIKMMCIRLKCPL